MRLIDADILESKVLEWMPPDPCGREEKEYPIETDMVASFLMEIDETPTVEQPKWIPCSERLPEDSGDYLVCLSDSVLEDYSDFSEVMIMPYDADCEAFGWWIERFHPISFGSLGSDFNEVEVLAWMSLPKPWRGAKE